MLCIFFAIYLLVVGRWASVILDRIFGLNSKIIRIILGVFASFVSLGWIAGVAILFLPLNHWVLFGIFALNALVWFLLDRWAKKIEPPVSNEVDSSVLPQNDKRKVGFASAAFLILVSYGFYLLYSARTGNTILTPWQVINPQYIFIFFTATLILGVLIWSRLKTATIILFLILQTFLLHSYLPLTHSLIYGADGWRHIANEQRILNGKQFLEAKIISANNSSKLKSAVGQLSYGSFWTSNVILAKIFKTDLLTITKWFLPVLWSLIFPLLLFEIGRAFGWGEKRSLFLVWLGLLPFAWQAGGSFSLPVSFGFLAWLFLVLLILKRVSSPKKEQVWILAGAGISLASGYVLYFILFWLAWGVAEVVNSKVFVFMKVRMVALFIFSVLFIPIIEILAGYSRFDISINWLGQIKQLLGNFFGVYLASGPRPHDIDFGNIVFNQTPLSAFVPNLLTQWRWWLPVFMLCFFAAVIYGCWRAFRAYSVINRWLAIVSVGIFGGYITTNYFLVGSHILARRLDVVVALFLILLFFYGLEKFILTSYKKTIWAVFILAIGITASYSLGPDTNTVRADEYKEMEYVWSQEKNKTKHCVVADTYPLLALEAISAKQIIGGGFPINEHFAQPEREKFLQEERNGTNITTNEFGDKAIDPNFILKAMAVTGAQGCWVVDFKSDAYYYNQVREL